MKPSFLESSGFFVILSAETLTFEVMLVMMDIGAEAKNLPGSAMILMSDEEGKNSSRAGLITWTI